MNKQFILILVMQNIYKGLQCDLASQSQPIWIILKLMHSAILIQDVVNIQYYWLIHNWIYAAFIQK